jgi:hypothetical protein
MKNGNNNIIEMRIACLKRGDDGEIENGRMFVKCLKIKDWIEYIITYEDYSYYYYYNDYYDNCYDDCKVNFNDDCYELLF